MTNPARIDAWEAIGWGFLIAVSLLLTPLILAAYLAIVPARNLINRT